MLFSNEQIEALAAGIVTSDGRRIAEVATTVSPLDMIRSGARLFGDARYFSSPDGTEVAGLGVAWRAMSAGTDRFGKLSNTVMSQRGIPQGTKAFLGFSFAPEGPTSGEWIGFAAADLTVPQVTLERTPEGGTLTLVVPAGLDPSLILATLAELRKLPAPRIPDPGDHALESHPRASEWKNEVSEAIAAIRGGSLSKVVLARSVVVKSEVATDPYDLVHHLRTTYPRCYTFGYQVGDAVFVGASPELLLSQRADVIRVNALAGSAPRGEGEEEDREVGLALLASKKDREEHRLVVDDIGRRLGPITSELHLPETPSLQRVATVQHLATEVTGTLRDAMSPYDVLASLHPTPAVGGTPREDAIAFIEKIEGMDRGWYSGGVGWISGERDAEITLSLRCGLLEGTTARLYAGAGIVTDSEPEAELIETRLKFRPLLNLLAAT